MRTIRRSSRFDKDYKRERGGRYRQALIEELPRIIAALAEDKPLAAANRDHALAGDKPGYRDCHIKPDIVLIYRKTEEELLLARLGSHSELDL